MEVFGIANPQQTSTDHRITRYQSDGSTSVEMDEVQIEHSLDVYINEELTLRIVCTPNHLVDLVVGRLYTEGIIKSIDDVESAYLYAGGTRIRVYLKDIEADYSNHGPQVVPTCCTGNRLINGYFDNKDLPEKVKPIPWDPEWIFSLARDFAKDTPMHRATCGTHSCYLACEDKILSCREDLGRHNAFDKVIGGALREGIDLTKCIIFTSGRLPVDMVLKGIRSGVPILVSKAVPTDMTIELAKEFDLTLICSARPDSMKVFNDPQQ